MSAICEAMAQVVQLALATGAESIKDLPGCWEYEFGEYKLSVNGHDKDVRDSSGMTVSPYSCFVSIKRFPFAVFDAGGGTIIGLSDDGCEDAFIEAVNAEIERITRKEPT